MSDHKLSFREKVGYGLGDMASNFYLGFFGIFLMYYYTDVFGISPAAAGFMLLITKIVDAISDPAMGLIADRTETKWGKYRPYLIWVAVPYAILGYLLFLGPDLSPFGKLAFAYVTYTLVMLAFTAINVPYSALLAVISPSAEERAKAAQYRFVFASIGTLTVGALATPLVKLLGGGDEVLGFRLTIILFAVLSIALFWTTFFTTKERIRPPKHDSSVKDDLKSLAKNISWVLLVLCGILTIIGLAGRMSSIMYYLKYYMVSGVDESARVFLWMDRMAFLTSVGMLGQLVGALLTPKLASLFEKRNLLIIMNLAHGVLLIAGYFVTPDQYFLTVVLQTLGMFTFGIVITLLFIMYTDCTEYGEWRFGKNTAGLTVSASMFSLKSGTAIGGALPGFILAAFGFVANQVQTDSALHGVRLMFTVLPAVFFFLGALVMMGYKIDRKMLRQIEADLKERRQT
ncbi:MFS transporter [Fretibacter rubidus]|uniref:MFS transporter n=1 Tax=Fretibacter rubidus TaxID=570162 RepID=UPI00352A5FF5